MARLLTLLAATLSFASLVLVAISMATNFWVRFDDRASDVDNPLNPLVTNDKFTGLTVQYDLDRFGLWVGCHLAQSVPQPTLSCGYIGASCFSNICWERNKEDIQCLDARVQPIDNCSAYQATRAMTIIGTLFLIMGASILVVSVCITSRELNTAGAVCTLIGGLFLMIGFAVFFDAVFNPLNEIASIAWSFVLLIIAWPLAILAGLLGITTSFTGAKQPDDQDFEESE